MSIRANDVPCVLKEQTTRTPNQGLEHSDRGIMFGTNRTTERYSPIYGNFLSYHFAKVEEIAVGRGGHHWFCPSPVVFHSGRNKTRADSVSPGSRMFVVAC